MPQVVTELTGGVASYVARLPMPAVDVTTWTASLNAPIDSPMLAHDDGASAKSLDDNDNKDDVTSQVITRTAMAEPTERDWLLITEIVQAALERIAAQSPDGGEP